MPKFSLPAGSPMTDISDRLDRIDVKLDKLSEAVSQLARIEERISHQTENMSQIDTRLNGYVALKG